MSNDKKIEINPYFFWLDLETTGLDPEGEDQILEVAVLITKPDLSISPHQFHRVIYTPDLPEMDPVVLEMHTKSGLFTDIKLAQDRLLDVENSLLDFLSQYPGQLVLCGSTVHFDRRFVRRYWPRVEQRLHYRMIDVSTIKLLAGAWWDAKVPKRDRAAHRALADVHASIEELRYWRAEVFQQPASKADVIDHVITQLERTLLDMSGFSGNIEQVTAALTAVAQVRKDRKAGLL
jgi:oligoribonuclease